MYIAILGRQPEFGLAELNSQYEAVSLLTPHVAQIDAPSFDFNILGGSQKAGRVVFDIPQTDWNNVSKKIIQHYSSLWQSASHKITLGISAYEFSRVDPRQIQAAGLALKKSLKHHNVSLRLIPNQAPALNTATSHHNKLGLSDSKIELLIVNCGSRTIVAQSIGAQNITALAARDQARPRTDAFVGMLPPKLARIMVNIALSRINDRPAILDPFCGTGVVLQEAALRGCDVYGSDLSEKMVDYSRENITWLQNKYHLDVDFHIEQGDAMTHTWRRPISAVVCEGYLGQPFSAPPSPAKLSEVSKNCQRIIEKFLANISPQIASNTPLIIAIPAWLKNDGSLHRLHIVPETYGFTYRSDIATPGSLVYRREQQVVARELLILQKT